MKTIRMLAGRSPNSFLLTWTWAIGLAMILAFANGAGAAGIHSTIALLDGTEATLCWESASNLIYQVQYRSGLDSGVWMDLGLPVTATGPQTCVTKAVDQPREFFRVVGPSLAWIPAGTFTMGSPSDEPARSSFEGPQTEVTISRGFWMGTYEVTQAEYLAVMDVNPSWFTGDLNCPVERVSWYDAVAYCEALTAQESAAGRLPEGYEYRLPTEAQWEYACRAGTTTPFLYGGELRSGMANFYGLYEYPPCDGQTYYCYNPGGLFLGRTADVGSYAPNSWGLYDLHGNVFEWCQDWWSGSLPGGSVTDPQGPNTGSARVLRGGTWASYAANCRSAYRDGYNPDAQSSSLGFRVVLVPAP